jgi:hypothetical protein
MLTSLDLRGRAFAAGLHMLISVVIAGLAAVLVFGLWYPGPFRLLAGGRDLFLLVTSVDVVIGPLLTFAVFNSAKGLKHLRRDLGVIGLIQTAALVYGLHTVYIARPVAMVFEVDRLRLVTADDVALDELPKAPAGYRELPLKGPWLLGTRRPQSGEEHNDALFKGLGGLDIGSRPMFWQSYEQSRRDALTRSRPLGLLIAQYPNQAADLRQRLAVMKAEETTDRFLPVMARGAFVAVLDKTGAVLGYLPLDGFF